MNTKEKVNQIFLNKSYGNYGSDNYSGQGSTDAQTTVLVKDLPALFAKYNIKSLLDAPCGDFNYMSHVISQLPKSFRYLGIDLSDKLINRNKKEYSNINFRIMDLKTSRLPRCECILIRDLFVHMTYQDIIECIKNIKKHNIKYILTTTFSQTGIVRASNSTNIPINSKSIFWQPLNLEIEPLNFSKPIYLLNENCTEAGNKFTDKSLGLWLVKNIKL